MKSDVPHGQNTNTAVVLCRSSAKRTLLDTIGYSSQPLNSESCLLCCTNVDDVLSSRNASYIGVTQPSDLGECQRKSLAYPGAVVIEDYGCRPDGQRKKPKYADTPTIT